jgi:hypothetical protein
VAKREPFPFRSLLAQVEATARQARELDARLSDRQLVWTPPEGGWGIGQCFEHLIVVADGYDEKLTPRLEEARASLGSPSLVGYRPTWIGRLFVNGVKPANPRRFKAPRVFAPPPEPRPNVVEVFCERQERLGKLLEQARGVDLSAYTITSPASRLLRFNLGDALLLLVYHAERHLNQATRVTEHPEFPAAADA